MIPGETVRLANSAGPLNCRPPCSGAASSLPTASVGSTAPLMKTFIRRPEITSLTWFQAPTVIAAWVWYSGYISQGQTPWIIGTYWMQSSAAGQLPSSRR